jgi:acetyl-CoA acetyltransferase
MENMDQAPYLVQTGRWGSRMGDAAMLDSLLRDGLNDAFSGRHPGSTAALPRWSSRNAALPRSKGCGLGLDWSRRAWLHSMRRDGLKRGVVTLCIGGGQGIALVLELL